MSLTLTLREAPAAPVVAETLRPDRIAGLSASEIERLELWHGNERTAVRALFDVAGGGADDGRGGGGPTPGAGPRAGVGGGRPPNAGRGRPPRGGRGAGGG